MSEVAKVREALERLSEQFPGQYGCAGSHFGIGTAQCPERSHHHHDKRCKKPFALIFVAHGLKICDLVETDSAGKPEFYLPRGGQKLDLISAILRDAGLLEEGR